MKKNNWTNGEHITRKDNLEHIVSLDYWVFQDNRIDWTLITIEPETGSNQI